MATREFVGNAVVTSLTGGVAPGDLALALAASTNWPTGTGADQFVVLVVSEDGATREKILCESRSGLNIVVATAGRGFDGTTAQTFVTGATVVHVADATWMQAVDDHLNDTNLDHHTQYLTEARHADSALHNFTDGTFAEPGAPEDVGTTTSAGTSDAPARADHRHQLGAGAVDSAAILGTDVVTAAKIADESIQPNHFHPSVVSGDGIELVFGILRAKVDGTTCQFNGSGEIEVLGGVVSTGGIADNAITNAKMADDAITAVELADNAVETVHILAGNVTTPKLADASVTAAKLAATLPLGMTSSDIAARTTDAGPVTTATQISGLSVTSAPASATRYRTVHFTCSNINAQDIEITDDNIANEVGAETAEIQIFRGATLLGGMRSRNGRGVDLTVLDADAPVANHVYTVKLQRVEGSVAGVTATGSASRPMMLWVQDIGGH